MRKLERPSIIMVVVLTLALAGLVGLVIPLASGSKATKGQTAWKPPTPIPPTALASTVPATKRSAPAPTHVLATPTSLPAATTSSPAPAKAPAAPVSMPTATTRPPGLTPSLSPTAEAPPTQLTSRSVTLPLSATATQLPTPTATRQPSIAATPVPGKRGTTLSAVVAVGLLNLRSGPGQGFDVIGLARAGETYTATARSGDGTWLQICCINQAPAWLATGMVTVTSGLDSLPVAP
jgi:hypothetical protein